MIEYTEEYLSRIFDKLKEIPENTDLTVGLIEKDKELFDFIVNYPHILIHPSKLNKESWIKGLLSDQAEPEIKLESLTVMILKPDDILVIDLHNAPYERFETLKSYIKNELGIKNKLLFLGNGEKISAIRIEKD